MDPQLKVKMHIQLRDLHYFDPAPVIKYAEALAVYKSHLAAMDADSSPPANSGEGGEIGNEECTIVAAPLNMAKCDRYVLLCNLCLISFEW